MISFESGILKFTPFKDLYQGNFLNNIMALSKKRNKKLLFLVDLLNESSDLFSDIYILWHPAQRSWIHACGKYKGVEVYGQTPEPDVFVNKLILSDKVKNIYVFDERFSSRKAMAELVIQLYPSFFRRPYQRSRNLFNNLQQYGLDRLKILRSRRLSGFVRMLENNNNAEIIAPSPRPIYMPQPPQPPAPTLEPMAYEPRPLARFWTDQLVIGANIITT